MSIIVDRMINIQLPIASPPWTRLGKRLESMCRKAIYDFSLLEGIDKLGVALSGGKDSLTLLYLLKAISGRGVPPFELYAFHVSGTFSCGPGVTDSFLSNICDALQIPYVSCPSEQREEELECYSCSRQRRRLIFQAAKEKNVTTIAFGHHRDDSIQTLLLNLLHKAEFSGNYPKIEMVDYGVTIVRPLIYICEKEIREFAKLYGFTRMVCQCPVGQNSQRRKVESLICEIEALFPNVRENLAQASRNYVQRKGVERP
jgi:tRNA 2-thiocytidine biosynthesis protein TtcA